MYNYAQNKWINATIQQSGGTVTSITAGTGLSGGTITGSGTIAIDSTYQTYISHGETAYGWGNHADAGYITQSAGDNRYLKIDFFRSLFRAYTSGNTEVTPNAGDTTTIDNIKAMFGFWTNAYISALGQNSSGGGGGGGGSSTLQGLLDVNIPATLTQDNDGQVLMYNYAQNKWINATIQQSGGTVTSITAGTGLSGGTITGSGTIAIDSTYQTYISHGETAYGWGNHADAGYWKSGNHPTTLSGYGITDAVNSSTTWWGQSVSNGVVSGSLTNVGDITSNTNGSIYSFSAIEFGTANNSGNGGALYFHFPGVFGHASSYIIEQSEGVLSLLGTPPTGGNFGVVVGSANGTYLQIGGIRLVYDSTNNALKVQKSDGTAGNFYATGGVSALGMSAGTSSVDTMTFNYVTINNQLTLKNNTNSGSVYIDDSGVMCIAPPDSQGTISIGGNTLNTEGGNIHTESGTIDTDGGDIYAACYFLDRDRYLYVSSGILYYYNGTTSKQVAFTN
jgi:hypothetical protein